MKNWKEIANFLHSVLPKIDQKLSQENVPIAARKQKAFDFVRENLIEINNVKAFLESTAYGCFLVIIDDWYRDRYGEAADREEDGIFVSMVLIHETPFLIQVPKSFRLKTDEPNVYWFGFPASVQAEEDPVRWIQNRGVVKRLSPEELEDVRSDASRAANLVRSIGFDVGLFEYESGLSVRELAQSVRADLQSSARNLCERNEASVRSAAWEASQATEKALKLLIVQKGESPRHIHDLPELAQRAENLGTLTIDRGTLALIPSGRDATNLRYGGEVSLSNAVDAYIAALKIVKQVLFEAKPELEIDAREARFKIQQPPWFDFDTQAFIEKLRET